MHKETNHTNGNYCSAEFVSKNGDILHPTPHSHTHYELYFLHSGHRDVFIDNDLYTLEDNCLAIIPPLTYHKTEGGEYARTNLSFNKDILDESLQAFLDALTQMRAVIIGEKHINIICALLKECDEVRNSSATTKLKCERSAQIIRTVLTFLSMQQNHPIAPASSGKRKKKDRKNITSEMLIIAQYINQNYMNKISLDDICKKFLISKTALNVKFKEVMQATVVDYLLSVRLKHAVYLLNHTRRSVEEISADCGFSSANYFGLIFKKKMGSSPSNYHRRRTTRKRGTAKKAQETK